MEKSVECKKTIEIQGESFFENQEYPAVFDAIGSLFAKGENGDFVRVMGCRNDAVFRQHFRIKS